MNFLALIPIKDWLYLAAITALLAGAALFVHHERSIGAARVEKVRQAETAQRAAVASAWAASSASETQRRQAAQQESDHEADRFTALADAGHARAVSALDGLRQRATAADARCLPRDPAAVAPGPAASAAGDLPADVLGRLGQAAVDIAAFADKSHGAGRDAEQQYDSLNLPRGLSPAGP
jgi:hypothetical protein